jgi:hypothetical protein
VVIYELPNEEFKIIVLKNFRRPQENTDNPKIKKPVHEQK